VLQQTYTIAGAIVGVSGGVLMIAYLLFNLKYDSIRRRRAILVLSRRPQLNSREFATKFFPESPETAEKLRESLAAYLQLDLGGLLPDDDLNAICDAQTDDPSLVWHLEQEFDLGETFTEHEEFLEIEKSIRTFRKLLEFVKNRSANS
jgi:hypothetical protein